LEEILPERKFIPGECVASKKPSAMALMAVNNETGRISDVESLKKSFPVPLLSDWVQGIGKIPFDPSHCDFATMSAHKIYGPKGVGILWMRDPNQYPELSQNHHTENIIGIAGMAKAFELLQSSEHKQARENIARWTKVIEVSITKNIPDSKIHDIDLSRAEGITNVAFKGVRGGELQAVLSKEEGICVSTGAACTSDILNPTSTIQSIEKDPEYQFPIRISLHQFLDDAAVGHFCEALEHHVGELRK
jgi:cysteine desulfurase